MSAEAVNLIQIISLFLVAVCVFYLIKLKRDLAEKIKYSKKWFFSFIFIIITLLVLILNFKGCKGGEGGDRNTRGGNSADSDSSGDESDTKERPALTVDERNRSVKVIFGLKEELFHMNRSGFEDKILDFLKEIGRKHLILKVNERNSLTARRYIISVLEQKGYKVSEVLDER